MVVPYDEDLGVHSQAEGFTSHQIWDFDATGADRYPLLLHYPYFDLYRKQVVKQADLVLAMHLRGDAFTAAEKVRNFAYYEALTVRDSSLSACTQAVVAAETGHVDLAYDYLTEAALVDLDDLEHNTRDGLHLASLAGAWIALVPGLAGLREHAGTLAFTPRLPTGITRLSITLCVRRSRLQAEITAMSTTYRVLDGPPVTVLHDGQRVTTSVGSSICSPNPTTPPRGRPLQPTGRTPLPHRDGAG
jgi:alpha,alpha-trehalose phosphorylase